MECVILKGNQHGLSIVIKNNVDFLQIKDDLVKKLEAGRNFFGKNKLSLTFEGIPLIETEQNELVDLFTTHSDLEIISVIDPEEERTKLREANAALTAKLAQLEEKLQQISADKAAQHSESHVQNAITESVSDKCSTNERVEFRYNTLRSGQQILTDKHVIIIGDVNNGARIESGGNVIVLGKLKGVVHAGLKSNKPAYVIALDMKPIQIRIKDAYGRASDETIHESSSTEPQVAFEEDGMIVIEKFQQKIFKDIQFN